MKIPIIKVRRFIDGNALRGAQLRGQDRANQVYSLVNMDGRRVALGRESDAVVSSAAWELRNEILRRKHLVTYQPPIVLTPEAMDKPHYRQFLNLTDWGAFRVEAGDLNPAFLKELAERDARTFSGPLKAFLSKKGVGPGPREEVTVQVSAAGIITIAGFSRSEMN